MPVSTDLPTLSIDQTDSRLDSARWFYTWNVGPLGECTCPRGSYHRQGPDDSAFSGNTDCGANPGKHPWLIWKNGEPQGFRHGAQEALPLPELLETYGRPGGARRFGMCLQDTMMIDIDSQAALQAFYRIWRHVPKDKILGVAKTPRGWHVYLHVPEWTQKAVSVQMRDWLGDWHGTDPQKISRRGLLLDIRTGPYRYTIWPGPESRDRHWATMAEFVAAVQFAGRGMPGHRMVQDGSKAPWNLVMDDDLRERIKRAGEFILDTDLAKKLRFDGSEMDQIVAKAELHKDAKRLEAMAPETGRNNALNLYAFKNGRLCTRVGISESYVYDVLMSAAAKSMTPGALATFRSGLTAALRDRNDD